MAPGLVAEARADDVGGPPRDSDPQEMLLGPNSPPRDIHYGDSLSKIFPETFPGRDRARRSADPAAFKLDATGRVVLKHAAELEATTEEPEATAEELAAAAEVSWDVGRTCHY